MGSTENKPIGKTPAIMIPAINADGSLYPVEKMEAHRTPQLHLAVSIFVFDLDGDLLIQQRARSKYHCPGLWANTCCSHPHWGEDIKDAADRRILEELGFSVPLKKTRIEDYKADVGSGLWEHERVHMFRADIARETIKPVLNPDEVDQVRWIRPADLTAEITKAPETFAPWFRIYADRFPDFDF